MAVSLLGETGDQHPRGSRIRSYLRRGWPDLLVVGIFVALAVIAYWKMWTAHGTAVPAAGGSDPATNIWFLANTPYSLLHGQSLLFSARANVPWGVNLMSNTAEQAAGVLGAPITLLFGAATALTALLTFAFASSATAAYFLLRRWTHWRGAAAVGGLVYGFSPYMIGQGEAHLNLVLVPIPPLIACVLDQLLVRRRGRPEVLGLILAALVIVQFFISTEVLLTTAIVCSIGLIAAAVLAPDKVRGSIGPLLRCGAVTLVVAGAFLVYPVWFVLRGTGHITGPIQALPQQYRADLSAIVVPSPLQAISPAWTRHLSAAFVAGDGNENGAYLGIPLLILLVTATAILWRRMFLVRFAAVAFLACWVLSLGARLTVSGAPSPRPEGGFPLPETVLQHIPLTSDVLPIRFTLYVGLFAGVLIAATTDALYAAAGRRWSSPALRPFLALAVPGLALIPLVPPLPYQVATIETPTYFTSAAERAVPPNATVLLYPFPSYGVDDAAPMVWQADTFLRFKIVGGYFLLPQSDGHVGIGRPTVTSGALNATYDNEQVPRSPATRSAIRAQLRSWHVSVVLADPDGPAGWRGVSFLTWLVGRPPVIAHGIAAWYRVRFTS